MFIFASSSSSRDNMHPASASTPSAPRRTNRYTRSSTTSVTQMISDGYLNLVQKLTNRVRGPSTVSERSLLTGSSSGSSTSIPPVTSVSTPVSPRHQRHYNHPSLSTTSSTSASSHQPRSHRHRDCDSSLSSIVGNARSRLEEKYSAILERKPSFLSSSRQNLHRHREREPSPFVREDRTLEPSARRSILKSPSTILLSEKAYPYVSPVRREKTPCGHERRAQRPKRNAEGRASGYA